MPGGGGAPLGAVFVAINANVSGLVSGTQLAKAELGVFGRKIATVQPQLQNLGMTATIVGAAMVAMSAGAVAHFAKFEQSIANVGSVLGKNYEQMDELKTLARKWGQTSVYSAKEVGDAMYYIASAGFKAQEVVDALNGTLTLAAATMGDLESTTIMVVAALNAFQLGASDADRVSNAFAATIASSQATAEKLGISMRYVGAVANSLGMSLEQTLAPLGILYNAGLEASQAGTALRMSFLKLVGTTPKADAALKELGLTAADVDPMIHSLVEIVDTLSKAGLTARQAKDIFGARSVAAMLSLVNAGSEALQEMEDGVTGTAKAEEMLAIQTDTLQGSMKKLKNAFGEIVLQMGEALAPIVRAVTEAIRDLAIWFGNLPSWLKGAISITTAVVGVFALLAGVFTLFLSLLPSIMAGFTTLGVVMHTALGPIGLIAAGITGLIALFSILAAASRNKTKSMIDGIEKEVEEMEKIKKKGDVLEALGDEYDTLKGKKKKTTEEAERFREVLEAIGQLAPELITAYDEFGKVLDIDREALHGMTQELADIHNLRAEINRDAWMDELKTIEDTRLAQSEALNQRLAEEKAAAAKLADLRRRREEGEYLGLQIGMGGTDVVERAEATYESARTAANALVDEIEDLNGEHERLAALLERIKLPGQYPRPIGPPVAPEPVVPEVDWEKEMDLIADQDKRLLQLKIANIKDEFNRRRVAAKQQYEEDMALAKATVEDSLELRLAAEERFAQESAEIDREERESNAAADRTAMQERLQRIRASWDVRLLLLEQELEKKREFYALDIEAYLAYLLAKREAYVEDSVERKALDEEIAELQKGQAQAIAREWTRVHTQISSGLANSIAGMVVEWDKKLKVFKKLWSTFAKGLVQSFVQKMITPLTDMLADFFIWAFQELLKLLAMKAALGVATGGAGFIGPMPLPTGQTGGEVERGGIARIHRGEQILPEWLASEWRRSLTVPPSIAGATVGVQASKMAGRGGMGGTVAPWDQAGMSRNDYMEMIALSTPDRLVVEPGGILSTDQDSIDTFFREIWVPAKRRYIEELRDSYAEELV